MRKGWHKKKKQSAPRYHIIPLHAVHVVMHLTAMEFSNLFNKCSCVVPNRVSQIGRFLSLFPSFPTAVGFQ